MKVTVLLKNFLADYKQENTVVGYSIPEKHMALTLGEPEIEHVGVGIGVFAEDKALASQVDELAE